MKTNMSITILGIALILVALTNGVQDYRINKLRDDVNAQQESIDALHEVVCNPELLSLVAPETLEEPDRYSFAYTDDFINALVDFESSFSWATLPDNYKCY